MKKTKNTIEITATIDLNEISTQLVGNLTPKELAEFVLNMGDNMSECLEFYIQLKNGLKDIDLDGEDMLKI
jgi:hypothetical protein